MGGTSFSDKDYTTRTTTRAAKGIPAFSYSADVSSGKVAARVHDKMDPKGVTRESRDSEEHPVTVPIMVVFDTTGSMGGVPVILEKKLCELMGTFLGDKACGKKYLGDGYPAICVGAVDDFDYMSYAGNGSGTLQIGQFESGIEIDEDLERIWLTGGGGGTYHESYELAMYFAARHTVHDHWEKRGRKGYLFIIGDEHAYPTLSRVQVEAIIGDKLEADMPLEDVIRAAQERYHVFFILPAMTSYYNDKNLRKYWTDLLGQQNFILLADPNDVCETIATAVAICEEHVGIDDLKMDGVSSSVITALVPLSAGVKSASITRVVVDLPVAAKTQSVARL